MQFVFCPLFRNEKNRKNPQLNLSNKFFFFFKKNFALQISDGRLYMRKNIDQRKIIYKRLFSQIKQNEGTKIALCSNIYGEKTFFFLSFFSDLQKRIWRIRRQFLTLRFIIIFFFALPFRLTDEKKMHFNSSNYETPAKKDGIFFQKIYCECFQIDVLTT